jgi:hypothetical protein
MVCKLVKIPPEICITPPLEAKKLLLNERKSQKQDSENMKKSLALSKSVTVSNDKEISNSINPESKTSNKIDASGLSRSFNHFIRLKLHLEGT